LTWDEGKRRISAYRRKDKDKNFYARSEGKVIFPNFFLYFLSDLRLSAKICMRMEKVFYV